MNARSSLLLFVLVLAWGVSTGASAQLPPPWMSSVAPPPERDFPHDTHPPDPSISWDPEQALVAASARSTPGPRRVLDTVRSMIDDSTVVRGSCFDWVDEVYHRAGGHSHDTYHGGHTGPFADTSQIQPGDWLFFINHEFGDDTHSAIFIGWVDPTQQLGMVASYAGGHRDEPARFGEYVLTSVFRVVRMTDEPPAPPTHRARRPAGRPPGPADRHRRG